MQHLMSLAVQFEMTVGRLGSSCAGYSFPKKHAGVEGYVDTGAQFRKLSLMIHNGLFAVLNLIRCRR